jgi:hypothetical protein
MSIHRKKSAVINSQVRIRNELSQIFVPTNNNLGISINTTVLVNSTGTISTKYATIGDINYAYSIGQNWVNATSGVLENDWNSVCWSPELGLFCAVSGSGTTANERVILSSDGITWQNASTVVELEGIWNSVCWSRELKLFLAVGYRYNDYGKAIIMTSNNGYNWIDRNLSSGALRLSKVCWSPELHLFCAVGSGCSVVSNDGINFTTNNTTYMTFSDMCWSPELGLFSAIQSGSNSIVKISRDGLNWETGTELGRIFARAICWSSELGLFVVGGRNLILISRDGLNWNYSFYINFTGTTDINSICWSAELGLFVAGGARSADIIISRDGLNWKNVATRNIQSVCWSPELSIFCSVVNIGAANQRVMITKPSYQLQTTNNYYIPLVSSNGTQEIKTKSNISYNINNNTLNLENLSTTNLPTCYAIPTKSTDLINRAYLNSFVGDYTQGWIREDWLSGDPSGNTNVFSWGHSYNYSGTNLTSSNITVIPSEAGRQGIIRLTRANESSYTILRPNPSIQFSSTQNVCARFLVRPFSNSSSTAYTQIRLFLAPFRGSVDYYNPTLNNFANMACWVFQTYNNNTDTDNIKWGCMVNTNAEDASYNYGLTGNSLRDKWVLFEIELNNQKPSFYITVVGETNRTLVYQEPSKTISNTVMLVPYILLDVGSVASTTSVDIDYIDIKYNNMSRR